MLRTSILIFVLAWPAAAAATDAGVATNNLDAAAVRVAPTPKTRPKTINFEDDTSGPSAGQEISSRNPTAVKHGSLMPDKYKRPPGGMSAEQKRGRGCAGCASDGGQTGGALLFVLAAICAVRRF